MFRLCMGVRSFVFHLLIKYFFLEKIFRSKKKNMLVYGKVDK